MGNIMEKVLYFHFVSLEYGNYKWFNLSESNWEYDKLVSMIVMRDPMERFLAGASVQGIGVVFLRIRRRRRRICIRSMPIRSVLIIMLCGH